MKTLVSIVGTKLLQVCAGEFCNSLSEKSSVSGGSQTPFTDKSIKSVQCTALKLIIGIF